MTGETARILERTRAVLQERDPEGRARTRLAELGRTTRVLGLRREGRLQPGRPVWHLGVLLLGDDGVFATGDVVRAGDPGRRGYTSEASRRRDEAARALVKAGFAEGESVHLGWSELDPGTVAAGGESGPLREADGVALVRWSPHGPHIPLEPYLRDRVDLLLPGG